MTPQPQLRRQTAAQEPVLLLPAGQYRKCQRGGDWTQAGYYGNQSEGHIGCMYPSCWRCHQFLQCGSYTVWCSSKNPSCTSPPYAAPSAAGKDPPARHVQQPGRHICARIRAQTAIIQSCPCWRAGPTRGAGSGWLMLLSHLLEASSSRPPSSHPRSLPPSANSRQQTEGGCWPPSPSFNQTAIPGNRKSEKVLAV